MHTRRLILVLALAVLPIIGGAVFAGHAHARPGGPPDGSDLLFPYWHSEIVDSEGDVGSSVALAVTANGEIHLAYYDATNSALKYAHGKPGNWQIETVDDTGIAGLCPALALDAAGRPHITYATAAEISIGGSSSVNAQRYARWTGTVWELSSFDGVESEPEPGRYVCLRSAIALDDGGSPHFAYSRTFWGPPKSIGSVRYARRDGDVWDIVPRIDGFGPYAGAGLDLLLDEGGRPQIAYVNDAWTYAGAPEVKVSALS
ncbi:MAG: hypothetical protein H3C34_28570, partial [Caldilineaceae bacterium]|nr:hypothetical protein [Caldilineaceae bacterium]